MLSTRADTHQRDEARARVEAAEAGDPRAVREILRALEAFLRGRSPIPRCYAVFCAECLKVFREDGKAWGLTFGLPGADVEFKTRDQSKDSAVERMLGRGERLSERRLRRVGTAACRAFHLVRRLGSTKQARTAAPEEESALGDVVIRFTAYFDVPAMDRAWDAQCGDPKALRELLQRVERTLREGVEIPGSIAYFCADSLQRWIEDEDAWQRIEHSGQEPGRRPSAYYDAVHKLGRSFCLAFGLSRPPGRLRPGEVPHELPFCPPVVYKLGRLLEHGVSWRLALEIASGTYPSYSSWTIEEWARLMEINPGAVRQSCLAANRLRLAAQVLRETARGRSQEEAYLEVAGWLARRLFPSLRSQMERWAARVLHESGLGQARPEEHQNLAQQMHAARERGERWPAVPEKLAQVILPEILAEEASTVVPDALIPDLIPAVREAYAFSFHLVDQWPRWARVWSSLERRYSRQVLAS